MSNTLTAATLPLRVVTGRGKGGLARGVLARAGRAGLVEHRKATHPVKRSDRTERARVREQIDRIVASADFDASRRSRDLLRFVVEETLAGRGGALTQAAIAIRVFDRREDFDALIDPIVRIQAGRLRRSLERYYLLSGVGDALRIELPRGTYVPAFRSLAECEPASVAPLKRSASSPAPAADWPSVGVGLFEPAAPGPEQQEVSARLNETLILELGRYPDVHAFLQSQRGEQERSLREPRFFLGGRIRQEGRDLRVTARLVDRGTGAQIWGDEYRGMARFRENGGLDDIARVIAARVGSEEGVVVQLTAAEHRRLSSAPITPYRAILLSYRFHLAPDSNSFRAAFHALRQVVDEEPECGLAWTALGRLCLANHAFEVTEPRAPIDEAVAYAQCGVRVDPSSRRARAVLAAALLVKGELAAARHELEDVLRLGPDSLVYLEVIGALLSLVGEGERGPALIRKARERNPHCLPHGSFGLWFDHLRRGEFEPAYEEALEYRDPSFFWRAVMRAICLAHLGRTGEAKAEVAEVLRARPDFAARGQIMVGRVIKLPEVMGQIVDGLAKAGLRLD